MIHRELDPFVDDVRIIILRLTRHSELPQELAPIVSPNIISFFRSFRAQFTQYHSECVGQHESLNQGHRTHLRGQAWYSVVHAQHRPDAGAYVYPPQFISKVSLAKWQNWLPIRAISTFCRPQAFRRPNYLPGTVLDNQKAKLNCASAINVGQLHARGDTEARHRAAGEAHR